MHLCVVIPPHKQYLICLQSQTYHRQFTLNIFHLKWGQCGWAFFIAKGGWMSLIVAITAVEHGGHHPPTQAIYIWFACDSLRKKAALWLRGKRRWSVKCWLAQARRREERITCLRASSVNHRWDPMNARGGEASPLTAPEEASPTLWIGESQGTSSCRGRFTFKVGSQEVRDLKRFGWSWGHSSSTRMPTYCKLPEASGPLPVSELA